MHVTIRFLVVILVLGSCLGLPSIAWPQTGPDLVVTDFWENNHLVQANVKNQGNIVCQAGHVLTLTVSNQLMDSQTIQTTLAPGKSITVTFPKFYWQCQQSGQVSLLVIADSTSVIKETNESNNYRSEIWVCDLTAPVILTGPEAQNITSDNADIVWTTDEVSDSTLRLGLQPGTYNHSSYKGDLVTNHSFHLTDLAPATRYYLQVSSVDEAGNQVISPEYHFETLPLTKPDLVIPQLRLYDHAISGDLRNQGEATAPAGHTITLTGGEDQYDEVVIDVDLAPDQEIEFTFPRFYFECTAYSHGFSAQADALSEVSESDETNNTRPLIILCEEPLAITNGPRAEVGSKQVSITWTTNIDANSLCDYGVAAGLYGQMQQQTKRSTSHKLILNGLLPGTTYQYRVTSEDQVGNRVQSRPAYFTTGAASDKNPPTIKSLNIRREPVEPLYYRMEAQAWDADSGIAQVQFFMDDELIGTDYSEPYEFLVTPGMLAQTRAEFFRKHRFSVVAVDGAMLAADRTGLFTPPYECAQINAHFIEPYPNETLYTRYTTVESGTTLPITVYAEELDWNCHFSRVGNERGEHPMICDEATIDVNEVRFYVNTVHLGTVTESNDDPWHEHQFTLDWDLGGYSTGTYHLRVDAVSDANCIQTITRDIHIEQGETAISLERRVWREGHVFTVELILHNEGTLPYNLNYIHDHIVGFQPIARTESDDDYEIIIDPLHDHCLSWDVTVEAGLASGTVEVSPGHHFVASYQAIPIQFIYAMAGHGVGSHEVEVVSGYPSVHTDTFDMIATVTEDGDLIDDAFTAAVAEANYLVVTDSEALVHEYGQAAAEDVLSTMAELARDRQGVLGYAVDDNPDTETWLKDTAIRTWGADMAGCDGVAGHFLSNGYLVLVGETEIVPAWTVDIPDWDYGGKTAAEVYFSDAPYADMSGGDFSPELITGRIIGDSAGQLIQAMRSSLDATFDRSLGAVTSGEEGDWEDFVVDARDITAHWREQQLDGEIMADGFQAHHWSRYIQKAGLDAPFYFPMSSGDGFLAANLTGTRVEMIRLNRAVQQANFALYEDLNPSTSPYYHNPHCTFHTGDAIASGDIDGDGEDEIVIGSIGTDEIIIGYDHSEPGTRDTAFAVPLSPWDVIACGDLRGDAREEIVVATRTDYGTVWIFSYENDGTPSLTLLDTLNYIPFDSWDGFAVGNVDSTNAGDEIIVGNASDDIIAVYSGTGTFLGQFPCDPYTAYDALAVGDFDGDNWDEMAVIIDDTVDSKRRLKIFQNDCWTHDPNEGWIVKDYQSATLYSRFLHFQGIRTTGSETRSDGFVAGDIDADGKEELLLAKEGDDLLYILDGDYSRGWRDRYLPNVAHDDDYIDLMVMRGHGNVNSCSPFRTGDIASFNFSDSPLILGLSCLTGGYEGQWKYHKDGGLVTESLGDAAFANAFFDQGAAVYIGSTEVSSSSNNRAAGLGFFDSWVPEETAGKAFRDFERSHISGDGWDLWVKEYNYYGDPKFGALNSRGDMTGGHTTRSLRSVQVSQDTNELFVTLDDYEVREVNGIDEVTIPGGTDLIQQGKPLVPCLRIERPLSAGMIVQDVQLRKRSDLSEDQGMNLPLGNTNPDLEGISSDPPSSTFSGWFPTRDFQWNVLSNGDGTRTLQIELYPFFYNNITREIRYYHNFAFELVTLTSPVYIVTASIDPNLVVGQIARIKLALVNNGEPRDVIIQATIKRYGTDKLLGGLLIDRLDTLIGPATYSSQWDSYGQEAGHCVLEVCLCTQDGRLLDQRTRTFTLLDPL